MQKGFDKQKQIQALEARVRNQRVATRELTAENNRLRDFVRSIGYDPDQFRYTDREGRDRQTA